MKKMGWRRSLAKKDYAMAKVIARKVGNKALVYQGRLEKSMERTQAMVGSPPSYLKTSLIFPEKRNERHELVNQTE